MQIEVGYSDLPDSITAGREAVQAALTRSGRNDPCDITLLFCTARHEPKTVWQETARLVGRNCLIFGGGATGIITNDHFGYGGDQVGAACIWLDGSGFYSFSEGNLATDERRTGVNLGRLFAGEKISPESRLLLFYDSIKRSPSGNSLVSATRLLEGIENELGFLPDIMGAGLQGDHIFTPTAQFLGDRIDINHAMALGFSGDIAIDNVIVHGCKPSTDYFKVTKADGSTILEINGEPALDFLDGLLTPNLTPADYPFFLILGVNHGKWDGEYDEKQYASRLCQGIDTERRGIVMFEPDMVEGTFFQIMHRTIDLDYILPSIRGLLDSLDDREPFFSLYINCAGRAAGLGGSDLEDAMVVQDIARGRFPLFGIYTGVEIASLGGKPRSLDWTGVFCVFSKLKKAVSRRKNRSEALWEIEAKSPACRELPCSALRDLCVRNTSKILGLDSQNIAIRNELEQKRRGFKILADLSDAQKEMGDKGDILITATQRINASLNMQRTALLLPYLKSQFIPFILQGYSPEEEETLIGRPIRLDPEFTNPSKPLLVTGAAEGSYLSRVREALRLPFFISIPIVLEGELYGVLITGRDTESPPFLSRLNQNDLETVQAIASLLATAVLYKKLGKVSRLAAADPLTGLLNRTALELKVNEILDRDDFENTIVFALIDLDKFKEINDKYGHLAGDLTLRAFADSLKISFRSTDILSRFGGDEFVVVCETDGNIDNLVSRIEGLVRKWRDTPISNDAGEPFFSTLSVGVAVSRGRKADFKELIRAADKALYKAKEQGRDSLAITCL